jgi:23S rRNA pseudouridine2605 synthase
MNYPIQLNKYIAHAGLCSRRKADILVKNGAIIVNNEIITDSAYKIYADDKVIYNNKVLKPEKKIYILLNKPRGYITTVADEKERKTVLDLIGDSIKERLYPIGRLDKETTGLLILTNDGNLAQKLAHPSYNIRKIYQITLSTSLAPADSTTIRQGIMLQDGFIKVDSISRMPHRQNTVTLTLHSGRNRIIRRIFEHLGYTIMALDRCSYGGLSKAQLPQGYWRFLTKREVELLYNTTSH